MKKHSRYNKTRKILIFWTLFIGTGALFGSICMLIDPTGKALGMDQMLPYFQKLPFSEILFQNLTFSGIALLIVNGVTNIVASIFLFLNKKIGVILGGIFGITLMLWICIQFYMFPFNFMSTIYFIFGFCQAVTGYATIIFWKQEHFVIDYSKYNNIGTNPEKLVVYFSRMGYTKTIALEEANKTGAILYELKTTEKVDGTLGFWWCGRFGMHRWGMPLEKIDIDFNQFEVVTICSPIWVFSIAAPIRSFCKLYSRKLKKVNYILVHHTGAKYRRLAEEMDALLNVKHSNFRSIQCKTGKFKEL